MKKATRPANQWQNDAMLAHTLPLFVFVIVGLVLSTLVEMLPFFVNYPDSPWYLKDTDQWIKPLQIVAGMWALLVFRKAYFEKDWNFSIYAVLYGGMAGLVGIAIWLLPTTLYDHLALGEGLSEAPEWYTWIGLEERREGYNVEVFTGNVVAQSIAVFLRFVYACVVVALVEEICWRSFVMRAAVDWDNWQERPFGESTWKSWLVSTALFVSIHQPVDYLGALIYGSIAWYLAVRTKSLASVVIMHGVANLLMGLYALAFQKYGLW